MLALSAALEEPVIDHAPKTRMRPELSQLGMGQYNFLSNDYYGHDNCD